MEEQINQDFYHACNLDMVNHHPGNLENHTGNLEKVNHQFGNQYGNIENQIDQDNSLTSVQFEEDWVPEELRELLQQDLQEENEQNCQFFATTPTNDPDTEKQRRRQNITINIDPVALLKRVKRLRNPHKALYKKVLKRNHKLKLRVIRQLRRRRRRWYKERGKGRERNNA